MIYTVALVYFHINQYESNNLKWECYLTKNLPSIPFNAINMLSYSIDPSSTDDIWNTIQSSLQGRNVNNPTKENDSRFVTVYQIP
ncbi:hypothetical protein OKW21_006067 [Catalinimonas alkaloidigena]|nr:hypothetical protein [Catalinimonas alkaloidigena]